MKLWMTVVLAVLVLLTAGYMAGKAVFTEFQGTEGPGGPPDFTATTINCPGGKPTGVLFPQPCTDGSRVHIRGAKFYYAAQTGDPRVTGLEEVTMNGNFDGWRADLLGPGSGQMWGTIHFTVGVFAGTPPTFTPTGGTWDGTWTGTRTVTGNTAESVIHAVAHGSGGKVEGLQADWHVILDPGAGVGVMNGRILDQGKK